MKISKRVREEAAMICQLAASNPGLGIGYQPIPGEMTAARWLDSRDDGAAVQLAWAAFRAADGYWEEGYADAESLLRTGWSPE